MLESAFNIVYGRPNRSFLRGKALATRLMAAALVVLFAGLLRSAASAAQRLERSPAGFISQRCRRLDAVAARVDGRRFLVLAARVPALTNVTPARSAG